MVQIVCIVLVTPLGLNKQILCRFIGRHFPPKLRYSVLFRSFVTISFEGLTFNIDLELAGVVKYICLGNIEARVRGDREGGEKKMYSHFVFVGHTGHVDLQLLSRHRIDSSQISVGHQH